MNMRKVLLGRRKQVDTGGKEINKKVENKNNQDVLYTNLVIL